MVISPGPGRKVAQTPGAARGSTCWPLQSKKLINWGHFTVTPVQLTPLGPDQYRARSVQRLFVPLAAGPQVVPEDGGSLLREHADAQVGEDRGATLLHVT